MLHNMILEMLGDLSGYRKVRFVLKYCTYKRIGDIPVNRPPIGVLINITISTGNNVLI